MFQFEYIYIHPQKMSHVTLVFLQMSIKAININIFLITNFC